MGFFDDVVAFTSPAASLFDGGSKNLLGDLTGANAAKSAADAETAAANNTNALDKYIYDTNRSDMAPYRTASASALSDLQSQMPNLTKQFTMADFKADPGYQFNLEQGQKAIQASAAARGLLNSTNTMSSLANYSQGMASNEFQNAYNRFTGNQNQRYNMLSGLANMGMGTNAQSVQSGANYANQYGQNQAAIGNANAASAMQGYNGMMGLANLGVQGLKAYKGMA